MNEREQGHVKWFSHQKRYGFIRRRDGLPDVFLHVNGFRLRADTHWVKEGDPVEFAIEQTPRGLNAVDVVVL
jgi:CspA family cold shock protein